MTQDTKTASDAPTGFARVMPIFQWLPNYNKDWLKGDLVAGLSVWALMVPTSLGYATISGVPVQYGLYAAAAGLIGFALFTTSRQVTQGPSSSTAAVLGAAVLAVASSGSDEAIQMAASIVLVAGALFIIMYLLRMGWISDFLAASVLTGFTFGGRAEYGRDIVVAFDVGFLCEIEVTAVGLALTGKRGLEVFLGL